MTYQYRQRLPDTPLDIVGDVHGEWDALQALRQHLGYRADGFHPQGRRLVFVGDLCDRGPDSPAVLAWVRQAQAQERAYVVLGNHELNLLTDDPKDGSGWFFDVRAAKDGFGTRRYPHCPRRMDPAGVGQIGRGTRLGFAGAVSPF